MIAITFASIVGFVKGAEAKQKWMFKIKTRNEEKRQLEKQKQVLKGGGVALDDIEISSYHRNWLYKHQILPGITTIGIHIKNLASRRGFYILYNSLPIAAASGQNQGIPA